MRRVVITGLGTINPLGLDVETSWRLMLAGESGVDLITRFDVSGHAAKIAAMVDWNPDDHFSPPDAARHIRALRRRR